MIKISEGFLKRMKKEGYDEMDFVNDAKAYIKAVKQNRMIVNIKSVAQSGMSRVLHFESYEKSEKTFHYRNYIMLMNILGYKYSFTKNGVVVRGCGMDMVFKTNYDIMRIFNKMGIITTKQFKDLSQITLKTL